jgi:hypothetical protein
VWQLDPTTSSTRSTSLETMARSCSLRRRWVQRVVRGRGCICRSGLGGLDRLAANSRVAARLDESIPYTVLCVWCTQGDARIGQSDNRSMKHKTPSLFNSVLLPPSPPLPASPPQERCNGSHPLQASFTSTRRFVPRRQGLRRDRRCGRSVPHSSPLSPA